MATQEELEVVKEINKELAKQVAYESKLARLNGESVDKLVERQSLLRQQRGTYLELQETMRFSEEEMQKVLKAQQTEYLNLKQKGSEAEIEMSARRLEMLNEVNRLQKDFVSGDEARRKIAGEILVAMEKQAKAQAKIKGSQDAGLKAGAGMVAGLNSVIKFQKDLDNTITGNLLKAIKTTEGFKETVRTVGIEMVETFGPANALQFLISNSIQTAVALDGLQASFVAATGASREYAGSIEDVFRANVEFGVGLAESSQAIEGLYTSFGAFSNLSKNSRDQIAGTAAQLQRLGVSATTTGDNFNFLVSQLGMGATEAESTIRSMTEEGAAFGIPPAQLNDSLRSLAPRLAAFGAKGPEIFMKAAKAAKGLGMTVDQLGDSLFALSDSLDTFEESAGAVAAINLSLGGSFVNAFDLTMATAKGPEEQLNMLRDAFQSAGKSMADMPFFQQKMLASELGQDIGTLTQLIDGNMTAAEAHAKANPMEEMAKSATTALDKLNKTLTSLSTGLEPLISGMNFLAENIKGIINFTVTLIGITQAYTAYQALMTLGATAAGFSFTTMAYGAVFAVAGLIEMAAVALANIPIIGGLSGALKALSLAMIANPVGAFIAGIALIAGAIYGLITNFDQVKSYFSGFFGDMAGMFTSFGGFAKGLARIILLPFDAVWGAIQGIAKGMVDLINLLPGDDIGLPKIFQSSLSGAIFGEGETPALAKGGMISSSGMAMVGEQGPELVNLPKGAEVVNNQNTTNLMKTLEETRVSNTTNNASASESAMLSALLRIEKSLTTPATAGGPSQPINISVKLDKKKVGEATVDYINKKYDVLTSN